MSDAKSGAKVASSGEPLIEEAVRNNLKFGSNVLLKNGPTSASFSFMFGLFKQTIQFLEQINVKMDLNPRLSKHELSPITTRLGLAYVS